jgi:hypothetical protein
MNRLNAILLSIILLAALSATATPTSRAQRDWAPILEYQGEIQADSIRLPVVRLDPRSFNYRFVGEFNVSKILLTNRFPVMAPFDWMARDNWGFNSSCKKDLAIYAGRPSPGNRYSSGEEIVVENMPIGSSIVAEVTRDISMNCSRFVETGLWIRITRTQAGFRVEELNNSLNGYIRIVYYTWPDDPDNGISIRPLLEFTDSGYATNNASCLILGPVPQGSQLVLGAYNYTKYLGDGWALFPVVSGRFMDEACKTESGYEIRMMQPIFKARDTGYKWLSEWGYIPIVEQQPFDGILLGYTWWGKPIMWYNLSYPIMSLPANNANITVLIISNMSNAFQEYPPLGGATPFASVYFGRVSEPRCKGIIYENCYLSREVKFTGGPPFVALGEQAAINHTLYSPEMRMNVISKWWAGGRQGVLEIRDGKLVKLIQTPVSGPVEVELPDGSRAVVARLSNGRMETPFFTNRPFVITMFNSSLLCKFIVGHRTEAIYWGPAKLSDFAQYRYRGQTWFETALGELFGHYYGLEFGNSTHSVYTILTGFSPEVPFYLSIPGYNSSMEAVAQGNGYYIVVEYVKADGRIWLLGGRASPLLNVLIYPRSSSPAWLADNAEKIQKVRNIIGLALVGDRIYYATIIAPWSSMLIMNPVPPPLIPLEIQVAPVGDVPVTPPKPCNDLLLLLITLTIMMLITSSYIYSSNRMSLMPHVAVALISMPIQIAVSVLLACSFITLALTIISSIVTGLTTTYMLTKKLREGEVSIEY